MALPSGSSLSHSIESGPQREAIEASPKKNMRRDRDCHSLRSI